MKREKLNKLFELSWEKNPKNGKPRRTARYIGKYYTLDLTERDRQRSWLLAEAGLAVVVFACAGLVNNLGSRCVYVLPFYAFSLLPALYFNIAALRLARVKETLREMDVEESIASARHAAAGLAVLGGLWALADAVFLFLQGAADMLDRELVFLACGLVAMLLGGDAYRRLKMIKIEEMPTSSEKVREGENKEEESRNHH